MFFVIFEIQEQFPLHPPRNLIFVENWVILPTGVNRCVLLLYSNLFIFFFSSPTFLAVFLYFLLFLFTLLAKIAIFSEKWRFLRGTDGCKPIRCKPILSHYFSLSFIYLLIIFICFHLFSCIFMYFH